MMQVKGSAITSLPAFITEKHGQAGLTRWMDSLSPEGKKIYGMKVLANNWYSLKDAMLDPTAKACELFYRGDVKGAWDMGRFSADYGLNGIYKIFVKVGSPEFIIKRGSTIIAGYYQPCKLEVVETGPKNVVLHLSQFPELTPFLEARISGWIQRALEINGCKSVMPKVTKSITKGSPFTEFNITWT
ncbi:hypothetical protein [Methanocella sp. MCL-LM]|uniref:hypothetical protein n=1 Tax=Methanocella sp. MCL-LM TaxID=3412035 RepID=UPI003C762CA5